MRKAKEATTRENTHQSENNADVGRLEKALISILTVVGLAAKTCPLQIASIIILSFKLIAILRCTPVPIGLLGLAFVAGGGIGIVEWWCLGKHQKGVANSSNPQQE